MPTTSTRGRITGLLPAIGLVALAIVVAACTASTSTATSPATVGSPAQGAGTTAAPPAADPATALPAFRLTATEHHDGGATTYGYEGPTAVPAGPTVIELVNDGAEEHQAGVGRLKPGVTYDKVEETVAAAGPELAFGLLEALGGPAGVAPGTTGRTIVDLPPGQYYVYCFVPDAQGVPHLSHGMRQRFEVTGSATAGTTGTAAPAPVPSAGTIDLQDFGIILPDGFAGRGWYRVDNAGPQQHEAVIYRATPGHTGKDLDAYLAAAGAAQQGGTAMPTEPFPGVAAGGVSAAVQGVTQWVWLDLDPSGQYVFLCGIPDPLKGFVPHFMEGMKTTWPTAT